METIKNGSEPIQIEAILERASRTQRAMMEAADVRRSSLERLSVQVRELAATNGDLVEQIETLEAEGKRREREHADEIGRLTSRINDLEVVSVEAADAHRVELSKAMDRAEALASELARVTEQYGRVAREFERFVDGVDRETVASVEAAGMTESRLVVPLQKLRQQTQEQDGSHLASVTPLHASSPENVLATNDEDDLRQEMADAAAGFGRLAGGM